MSESSYNNSSGESSYGSSDKYYTPPPKPVANPQYHAPSSYEDYESRHTNTTPAKPVEISKPIVEELTEREKNIIKAKAVLRDCEETLLASSNHLSFLEKTDYLKNFVRNLVVHHKEVLIASPTYSTVYSIYEDIYVNLPLEEQKNPIQNIIIDILCEKVAEEKRNTSELKYW